MVAKPPQAQHQNTYFLIPPPVLGFAEIQLKNLIYNKLLKICEWYSNIFYHEVNDEDMVEVLEEYGIEPLA